MKGDKSIAGCAFSPSRPFAVSLPRLLARGFWLPPSLRYGATGLAPLPFTFHLSPFTFPFPCSFGYRLLFIGYSRRDMYRSRLRLIGLILLVLGLGTAEGVYWFGEQAAAKAGTQQSDEIADSIQLENQRKADREVEMGFGKVYVMVIHAEGWWAALPLYKQVAFGLAAVTIVVAGSGFILAAQLRQ